MSGQKTVSRPNHWPPFRRSAAAVAALTSLLCLVSATGKAQPARPPQPGTSRWPVKTSVLTPRTAGRFVELSRLLALPDVPGVARNDPRYQSDRILGRQSSVGQEGDLITTAGWLHLVALEDEGDYHMQISASPTEGNNCLVVEVPKDDAAFVADALLRERAAAVRLFVREQLLHDPNREVSDGGNVMVHPPYVRVTGALFYDDGHVGDAPRGKRGMKAATLWELHPVVSIRFSAN